MGGRNIAGAALLDWMLPLPTEKPPMLPRALLSPSYASVRKTNSN